MATGEFIEEQIFNWTYTDEQPPKEVFAAKEPEQTEPLRRKACRRCALLTYQMPPELLAIASRRGVRREFDLNAFFEASGTGEKGAVQAQERRAEVAGHHSRRVRTQGGRVSEDGHAAAVSVFGCASAALPAALVLVPPQRRGLPRDGEPAGREAQHFLARLRSGRRRWRLGGHWPGRVAAQRKAIGSGFETKTVTLSCGKLTTGITVPPWSSILMLRNLKSPETYFQAAFRVQSPWSIKNPNGDNPNEEEILKPICFVFDFAPTRALRQLSEYAIGLSPNESNPENAVKDLVSFLPVLAYDGART